MQAENKPLTGYPSIDKPWLKYYKPGAEERATNIPAGKTVWDVIEQKLLQYKDIPAIEYFGCEISRPEFIDMVYTWARAFKALGVKEDEVVPYYGPFFPDVGAMAFALNIIGACPYFLKLAISPAALAEETTDSRIAIVYSDMWANVSGEFAKDRFEKVIFVTATDAMSSPKKQIVSLLGKLKRDKKAPPIPHGGKYLRLDEAKKYSVRFSGEVKAQFVPDRAAFITSSSGTTVGGVVKGCVATNESVLAQLYSMLSSDAEYVAGYRTLNHFPPTAATSLSTLFFAQMLCGVTVILDPRVSEKDFYNQLVIDKPTISINTASMWELFFNRIERELANGKKFDFSYAKFWMVGGEGASSKQMQKWTQLMRSCGAEAIYSGYGLSETFSGISYENEGKIGDLSRPVASSGLVQAGMTAGIFDKNGNELSYHHRGELWVKTKSAMKGYYNKPELTAKTIIDGWIHTGDLAEIDENGFVYIWGRLKDTVTLPDGREVYLFDIANKIKENENIDDAIVLSTPTENSVFKLVAHIVWSKPLNEQEKADCLTALNKAVEESFPVGIRIAAYAEHDGMLPYSPTTLKKDKNKMAKQTTGFVQVVEGRLHAVSFELTEDSSGYTIHTDDLPNASLIMCHDTFSSKEQQPTNSPEVAKDTPEVNAAKRNNIIAFVALIVSFLSLAVSSWSFNPFNKNLEARAESGSVKAQMILADYSLDIGEYKKSLYWYTVAVSSKGAHLAKAYNNMGYIFVKYIDLLSLTPDYYLKTLEHFQEAIELGSLDAMRNEYIFLKSFPEEVFRDIQYQYELRRVERLLRENNKFDRDLEMFSTGWERVTTTDDYSVVEEKKDELGDDAEYISFIYKYETRRVGDGVQVVPYFDVYRKTDSPIHPPYVRSK